MGIEISRPYAFLGPLQGRQQFVSQKISSSSCIEYISEGKEQSFQKYKIISYRQEHQSAALHKF
jgi:hypothetical protein